MPQVSALIFDSFFLRNWIGYWVPADVNTELWKRVKSV